VKSSKKTVFLLCAVLTRCGLQPLSHVLPSIIISLKKAYYPHHADLSTLFSTQTPFLIHNTFWPHLSELIMAQAKESIRIDLGTTIVWSRIMEAAEPKVIPNSEGTRLHPQSVRRVPRQEQTPSSQPARASRTNPKRDLYSGQHVSFGRRTTKFDSE